MTDVNALRDQARQFAANGLQAEAAHAYEQLLAHLPEDIGALSFLGRVHFQRGELERSEQYVRRALACAADDPVLHQNLALILRAGNQAAAALDELHEACRLAPQTPGPWLHRGALLDEAGRLEEAAACFAVAFNLAPDLQVSGSRSNRQPALRALAQQGGAVLLRLRRQRERTAIENLAAVHGDAALERARRFRRIHHGEEPRAFADPRQRPSFLYFPGLPPQPWFEREAFDWVPAAESSFADVRAELARVLARGAGLNPYLEVSQYAPPDWDHLHGKLTWSAFHLLKGGKRVEENCALCPATMAMLESLPLVYSQGNAPEAFFSVLKPGTVIPPHYGLANTKVAVHLPLIVPGDCAIRVGGETRTWTEGRCLMFDDSFEHEAWNRSDQTRAVLIFEVWNPHLTQAERAAVSALVKAGDDFHHWSSELRPDDCL